MRKSRPNYLELGITLLACFLILGFFLSRIVKAHDHSNQGGWKYDSDCCGAGDCSPIDGVMEIDGKYYYTTKLGSKPVVPQTKLRRSGDGLTHACIYQDRLWCLYVPDGN